jgi:uncharacterized protein (TIGR02001 family)
MRRCPPAPSSTSSLTPALLALATVATLAGCWPSLSFADDALAFNVGAVSDYRYRGISQTRLDPAVQGGIDATLPAGFYLGTWASTIRWIKDAGGDANAEWDLYGGWKHELAQDLTLDLGVLRYQYVDNALPVSANTTELYAALSVGAVTTKYSHSVTNLFGFAGSKGSGYVEVAGSWDVGHGISLAPHLGYQRVAGNGDFSCTDYSLTASKDLVKGLTGSVALVGADTKSIDGVKAYASPANGKDLGKAGVVVGLKYVF